MLKQYRRDVHHGVQLKASLASEKKGRGAQLVHAFIDAIVRDSSTIGEADLDMAYERVGLSYYDQMQQNFVILTDNRVKERGGSQEVWGGVWYLGSKWRK